MTDMSVLTLLDSTKTIFMEKYAYGVAIGVVTSQVHPLAFFSKKMSPRMQIASMYVLEMHAIT